MFKNIFYFFVFQGLVLLSGCSIFFEVEPEISQVKKIGFLSVYINDNFYDRTTFTEDVGIEMLGFFGGISEAKKSNLPEELAQYFLDRFYWYGNQSQLQARGITLVPTQDYLDSPAYLAAIKGNSSELDLFNFDDSFEIEKNYFSVPKKMKLLPINKLVKSFEVKEEQSKLQTFSITYADIGDFSKGLELDGLLIAEIDAGYEKIEFLEGSKIKPSITLRILLIDREGRSVLTLGEAIKEDRKHYTGKITEAEIRDKYVVFSNSEDLSRVYREAIDKGLEDFFKVINRVL